MTDANSFKPTEGDNSRVVRSVIPHSQKRWAFTGFLLFASPSVVFGCYRFYQASEYNASLPPGTAACGMASMGAMMIMIIVGPAFGLIGFAAGWFCGRNQSGDAN